MAFDPRKLATPGEARQYMANAKRLGNVEAYNAGFRRLCELAGPSESPDSALDAFGMDVWAAISAYEQLLTDKNGRRTAASRTRQKLARDGYVKTVEDLATTAEPSPGFKILAEAKMPDLTFEYLVLKYPDRFSERAQAAARSRLESFGVSAPT